MKKRIIIVSSLIFGLLFIKGLTNYVSKSSLEGRYINNNTNYALEGPRPISQGVDTLVINNDNSFDSQTWGTGTYKVKPSIFGTRIDLTYDYEMGKAGYEMLVTSPLFGRERIWLNHDLNYYFEKIKTTANTH